MYICQRRFRKNRSSRLAKDFVKQLLLDNVWRIVWSFFLSALGYRYTRREPVDGCRTHVIEHRTSLAKVMSSISVDSCFFFRLKSELLKLLYYSLIRAVNVDQVTPCTGI